MEAPTAPRPTPQPPAASHADTDRALEASLYQQQLRAVQEQLAVALEEGRRLGREAEQAAGRQAILTRTVDDLARRLQDALCQREELQHKLAQQDAFWGPAEGSRAQGPASPSVGAATEDYDDDYDDDNAPMRTERPTPYCEDPDPMDWRPRSGPNL